MKLMERHPIDPRYPLIPLYTGGRENCIAFLRQTAQAGYACSIEEAVSIGPTNRLARRPRRFRRGVYFCINDKLLGTAEEFTIIPFFRSP